MSPLARYIEFFSPEWRAHLVQKLRVGTRPGYLRRWTIEPPITAAVSAGEAIIAAMNGTQATQAQANAITAQTAVLNATAATKVTAVANGALEG